MGQTCGLYGHDEANMRQRKEIAYPKMGVFVHPRPRGRRLPISRHVLRMNYQTSGVKVSRL